MDATDDSWTTKAEDAVIESAVLRQLLDLHPARLTGAELIRELAGEMPGFAASDAIERAVRDLTGAGLLRRHDDLLTPTRAALRFNELLDR